MKKILAGALSVLVFFSHSLFAYRTETTLWSERRPVSDKVGFGALPLPSKSLLKTPVDQAGRWPVLAALPAAFGSVRSVVLPSNQPVKGTVVHIQDIHQNFEAQKNIGRTVQALVDGHHAGVIALEGAFGDVPIETFRTFPRPDITRSVADYLLKQSRISGPIHAAYVGSKPFPRIIGVDDPILYRSNVAAYKASTLQLDHEKKRLQTLAAEIAGKKAAVFNPALKIFDDRVSVRNDGRLSLGDYVAALSDGTELPAQTRIFMRALRAEKTLDFAVVEKERAALIGRLVRAMDEKESRAFLDAGSAYRMGNISHKDFYSALQSLCRRKKIHLSAFPAMEAYVNYTFDSDRINPTLLFEELRILEDRQYARLAKTDEERVLIDESKRLRLTAKLIDFSLNADEWNQYLSVGAGSPRPTAGIVPMGGETPPLRSFEDFYGVAVRRDGAMADNLLRNVNGASLNGKPAILVTGGFHSAGIGARLKKAGYAVVTWVPKISKVETATGSAYLNVFAQEKTPLDKIFEGEKLFLGAKPDGDRVRTALLMVGLNELSNGIPRLTAVQSGEHIFPDSSLHFTAQADGDKAKAGAIGKLTGRSAFVLISARLNGDSAEILDDAAGVPVESLSRLLLWTVAALFISWMTGNSELIMAAVFPLMGGLVSESLWERTVGQPIQLGDEMEIMVSDANEMARDNGRAKDATDRFVYFVDRSLTPNRLHLALKEELREELIDRDSVWRQRKELMRILSDVSSAFSRNLSATDKHQITSNILTIIGMRKLGPGAFKEDVLRALFANSQAFFERQVPQFINARTVYDEGIYSIQGPHDLDYSHLRHFSWLYAQSLTVLLQLLSTVPSRRITVVDEGTGNGHLILTASKFLEDELLERVRFIGVDQKDQDMRFGKEAVAGGAYPNLNVEWMMEDVSQENHAANLLAINGGRRVDLLTINHVLEYFDQPLEIFLRLLSISDRAILSVPLNDSLEQTASAHRQAYTVDDLAEFGGRIEEATHNEFYVDYRFLEGGMLLLARQSALAERGAFRNTEADPFAMDPKLGRMKAAQIQHVVAPFIVSTGDLSLLKNQLKAIARLKALFDLFSFEKVKVLIEKGEKKTRAAVEWIETASSLYQAKVMRAYDLARSNGATIAIILNSSLNYDADALSQNVGQLLNFRYPAVLTSNLSDGFSLPLDFILYTEGIHTGLDDLRFFEHLAPYMAIGAGVSGALLPEFRDEIMRDWLRVASFPLAKKVRSLEGAQDHFLPSSSHIVFLDPHPDDITIAGGVLAKRLLLKGNTVTVLGILSEQIPERLLMKLSEEDRRLAVTDEKREEENREVFAKLQEFAAADQSASKGTIHPINYQPLRLEMSNRGLFASWESGAFAGGSLIADSPTAEEYERFSRALTELKPDVLVIPAPYDNHHGHHIVRMLALDFMARSRREGLKVPRVWELALASNEFRQFPFNVFLIPSPEEEREKRELFSLYHSQGGAKTFDNQRLKIKYGTALARIRSEGFKVEDNHRPELLREDPNRIEIEILQINVNDALAQETGLKHRHVVVFDSSPLFLKSIGGTVSTNVQDIFDQRGFIYHHEDIRGERIYHVITVKDDPRKINMAALLECIEKNVRLYEEGEAPASQSWRNLQLGLIGFFIAWLAYSVAFGETTIWLPMVAAVVVFPSLVPMVEKVARVIAAAAGEPGKNRSILAGFDGQSGSGKSTLVTGVSEMLGTLGYTVVVIQLDRYLHDPSWRGAIQKLVLGLPLTSEEDLTVKNGPFHFDAPDIFPTDRFELEEEFWNWTMIQLVIENIVEAFRGNFPGRLRITNYVAYDQATRSIGEHVMAIGPKSIVLIDGKYANQEIFRQFFDFCFRIGVEFEQARRQFLSRITKRGGNDLESKMKFFDATRASFEAYSSATQSHIDYLVDVLSGTLVRKPGTISKTVLTLCVLGAIGFLIAWLLGVPASGDGWTLAALPAILAHGSIMEQLARQPVIGSGRLELKSPSGAPVDARTWDRQGNLLVFTERDEHLGAVRSLYHAKTGAFIFSMPFQGPLLSGENGPLFWVQNEHRLVLFDNRTGEEIVRVGGNSQDVNFLQNLSLFCFRDPATDVVRIFNTATLEEISAIDHPRAFAFNENFTCLYVIHADGSRSYFHLATGAFMFKSTDVRHDGNVIIVSEGERRTFWSALTGDVIAEEVGPLSWEADHSTLRIEIEGRVHLFDVARNEDITHLLPGKVEIKPSLLGAVLRLNLTDPKRMHQFINVKNGRPFFGTDMIFHCLWSRGAVLLLEHATDSVVEAVNIWSGLRIATGTMRSYDWHEVWPILKMSDDPMVRYINLATGQEVAVEVADSHNQFDKQPEVKGSVLQIRNDRIRFINVWTEAVIASFDSLASWRSAGPTLAVTSEGVTCFIDVESGREFLRFKDLDSFVLSPEGTMVTVRYSDGSFRTFTPPSVPPDGKEIFMRYLPETRNWLEQAQLALMRAIPHHLLPSGDIEEKFVRGLVTLKKIAAGEIDADNEPEFEDFFLDLYYLLQTGYVWPSRKNVEDFTNLILNSGFIRFPMGEIFWLLAGSKAAEEAGPELKAKIQWIEKLFPLVVLAGLVALWILFAPSIEGGGVLAMAAVVFPVTDLMEHLFRLPLRKISTIPTPIIQGRPVWLSDWKQSGRLLVLKPENTGDLYIFDLVTGKQVDHLAGVMENWGFEGQLLWTLTAEPSIIRIYNTVTGKELRRWENAGRPMSNDQILRVYDPAAKTLHIFNSREGVEIAVIKGVTTTFETNSGLFIVSSHEGNHYFSFAAGRELMRAPERALWSGKEFLVLGISDGGHFDFWNIKTGRKIASQADVQSWNVEGAFVVTRGADLLRRAYSVWTGEKLVETPDALHIVGSVLLRVHEAQYSFFSGEDGELIYETGQHVRSWTVTAPILQLELESERGVERILVNIRTKQVIGHLEKGEWLEVKGPVFFIEGVIGRFFNSYTGERITRTSLPAPEWFVRDDSILETRRGKRTTLFNIWNGRQIYGPEESEDFSTVRGGLALVGNTKGRKLLIRTDTGSILADEPRFYRWAGDEEFLAYETGGDLYLVDARNERKITLFKDVLSWHFDTETRILTVRRYLDRNPQFEIFAPLDLSGNAYQFSSDVRAYLDGLYRTIMDHMPNELVSDRRFKPLFALLYLRRWMENKTSGIPYEYFKNMLGDIHQFLANGWVNPTVEDVDRFVLLLRNSDYSTFLLEEILARLYFSPAGERWSREVNSDDKIAPFLARLEKLRPSVTTAAFFLAVLAMFIWSLIVGGEVGGLAVVVMAMVLPVKSFWEEAREQMSRLAAQSEEVVFPRIEDNFKDHEIQTAFGSTLCWFVPSHSTARRRLVALQYEIVARLGEENVLLVPADALHLTAQGIEHDTGTAVPLEKLDQLTALLRPELEGIGSARGTLSGPEWHPDLGIVMVWTPAESDDPLLRAKAKAAEALGISTPPRPFHITLAYPREGRMPSARLREQLAALNEIPAGNIPIDVDNVKVIGYGDVAFVRMTGSASTVIPLGSSREIYLNHLADRIAEARLNPALMAAVLPAPGPLGVEGIDGATITPLPEGGFAALTPDEQATVIEGVRVRLASEPHSSLTLSAARFLAARLHGVETVNVNLGVDVNVRKEDDLAPAARLIDEAFDSVWPTATVAMPETATAELKQSLLSGMAPDRVRRLVFVSGNFFKDGKFTTTSFVEALSARGLKNFTVAPSGSYEEMDQTIAEAFIQQGVLRQVVSFSAWVEGLLGFSMKGDILMKQLDALAKAMVSA